MAKTKTVLGIDIGTVTIKIVEVESVNDTLKLLNYVIFPIPQTYLSENLDENERLDHISNILKEVLKENKIKTSKVCVSIASNAVFTRFVKMPFSDPKKLDRLITFEAQQQIPFPLDEVSWDYQIVGKNEDEEFEVLIAAIKQEHLHRQFQSLSNISLSPAIFDVGSLATYNALLNSQINIDETAIILDIGANPAVMILHHPKGYWVRTLAFSSKGLTQALMKEFNIDYDEAESLKYKGSILNESSLNIVDSQDLNHRINIIITQNVKKLYTEITRSLNFYKAQFCDVNIDRFILAGGGSMLESIQLYLSSKFKINVDYANPFMGMQLAKNISSKDLNDIAYLFCESVGLGLRVTNSCKVEFNLMTISVHIEQTVKKYLKYFYISMIILIITFNYSSFTISRKNNSLQKIKTTITKQHHEINQVKTNLNKEQNKLDQDTKKLLLFKEIADGRGQWLSFLLGIGDTITEKMYLKLFSTSLIQNTSQNHSKTMFWQQKSNNIKIAGVTKDKDDLSLFKDNLTSHKQISEVKIVKAFVDNENNHIEFELNVKLK